MYRINCDGGRLGTHYGVTVAMVGLLWAGSLFGSVVVQMDLKSLVAGADTIIQGRAEAVYSQWDSDRRVIYTYISIGVDEILKGESRRSLLIKQLGGTVGSLVMTVSGMPGFEVGAGVIVFLEDSGNGTFQIVGLNQGKYVIAEDSAISNISGVDLLNPKTGLLSGASVVNKVPLEEFKDKIRELVR